MAFLPLHLPASSPTLLTARASSTAVSVSPPAQTSSLQVQLEETFGRKGIRFGADATGAPTAELSVRNGSSLRLRLNDGLVTSYRPKVSWKEDKDGGCREILHTVSDSKTVKGGVGLVLNHASSGSPSAAAVQPEWSVSAVDSDSYDAVQVELGRGMSGPQLEVAYVVTLYATSMATAVIVKNAGKKPVALTGAVLSHIKFDKRRGTAVEGLMGCPYCAHPPPASGFALLTPAEAMKREESGWFGGGGGGEEPRPGEWAVEENRYTILKKKVSRVYAAPPEERKKRVYNSAPSNFMTIDQSSGLGFRVVKMGFEDMYLSSPGGMYDKFGNDYFLCTGPASLLVPVVVNPGEEWRAAQVIEHDNL